MCILHWQSLNEQFEFQPLSDLLLVVSCIYDPVQQFVSMSFRFQVIENRQHVALVLVSMASMPTFLRQILSSTVPTLVRC